MVKLTPAMQQYMKIKNENPDCIVLFRMGDFYELFYEDAKTASRELDIVLTSRGKGDTKAPLAGIPYHSIETYLAKLVKKGYKVAICEQMEDPKKAKGLVKRDLVRIITPGTLIDDSMLDESSNNYIMSFYKENEKIGIAFADISTGEFLTTELKNDDELKNEVMRFSPAEIIIPLSLEGSSYIKILKSNGAEPNINTYDDRHYWNEKASKTLKEHFNVISLDGFGLSDRDKAVSSSGALLSYLIETQKKSLTYINKIKYFFSNNFMTLDSTTVRNLELIENIRDKSGRGTVLSLFKNTITSMGSRLLKKWLMQPLISIEKIQERLDAVEELTKDGRLKEELISILKNIQDLERLISRVTYGNANPRDLVALKNSLKQIPLLSSLLIKKHSKLLKEICTIDFPQMIVNLLDEAILDEPNAITREGNIIKRGYNYELDELYKIKSKGKKWILDLEETERKKTGIKSLKIKYNRIFGYFIEVTKPNLHLVPGHYIRKQTQANSERYLTQELKEKEEQVLGAEEKINELEFALFNKVVEEVAIETKKIQEIALKVAKLDCLLNFADVAIDNRYVRPEVHEGFDIELLESRHPVLEQIEEHYVPNDIKMSKDNRTIIITGPNMSGKCISGESIIFTNKGMIPIKHFQKKNSTKNRFSPLKLVISGIKGNEKCSHFYYDGKKPTIKIKTKFGYQIEGTYNHPILVRTREGKEVWKKLSEIDNSDFIIIKRKINLWGNSTRFDKNKLKKVLDYNYNNNVISYPIPNKLDKELAYLIGLLIGDGTLTRKLDIIFSNIDQQLIQSFYNIIKKKFKYKVKRKGNKDSVVLSKKIRLFFEMIGLGYHNALRKTVPFCILNAPKNLVKEFLQGLFDTDGEIGKKYGNVYISTSSKLMAKQIHMILLNFGIISSLRPRETKVNVSYRISIYGENAILFNKIIGFKLKRKKQRSKLASKTRMPNYGIPYTKKILKDIQARIVNKQNKKIALKKVKKINSIFYIYIPNKRNISHNKLTELIEYCDLNKVDCKELKDISKNYYFYDSIKEISKSSTKKEIFDFSVPNTHSFTANGFINHNSSCMRQVALITLMAQIGCFVPASKAKVPIVDRIFTRVGASDDLYSGHSTFMVEMNETAQILNNATEKSLIILDEIGRGTSTYDGISIAWAVAEFIHASIKAKTMFATHYHQLNKLSEEYDDIKNMNIAVKEEGSSIVFLHKLLEGGTDKSYGIQVANLAGLPKQVIEKSKIIMNRLEMEDEIGSRIHKDMKKITQKQKEERTFVRKDKEKQKSLLDL